MDGDLPTVILSGYFLQEILSYLSNATGLRSIGRLDIKLCMFQRRVVRMPRERKLSKIRRSVKRKQSYFVDRH